jgi:WD40 repeat protein
VFVSYAHESNAHRADVRRLHDLLAAAGLAPILDVFHDEPGRDWALWMRDQVDTADWVLVIASAAYKRRADSPQQLPEDEGRGVWWEARYLRGILYSQRQRAGRFLPVVLLGGSAAHLPNFFAPDTEVFAVAELTTAGVAELVATLSGRAPLPASLGEGPPAGWVFAGAGAGRASADAVREHVESRGRGQRSRTRAGDLFRGRVEALKTITGWLQAPQPPGRVLVITGQPGAGKSAVVARAALDLELVGIDQGSRLGLVFHARSATVLDFLHAVAVTTRTSSAETVSGMIDRVRPADRGCWRLVVDALDETATGHDRNQIGQAVAELAALGWRVVVATRALSPDPVGRFGPGATLPMLGVQDATAENLVDLDTDRFFEPGGLREFAAALLRQDGAVAPGPPDGSWQQYRLDAALSRRLAARVAERAGSNHLVAALAADPLSQRPTVVDPDAVGFDPTSLPTTVGEALGKYLDQQAPAEREQVRGLLTALAYARGAGIDDGHWLAFAGALGFGAQVVHLEVLRRGAAADCLLQSSTVDGARITRLFHQALADELLTARPRRTDEGAILDQLLPRSGTTWVRASDYAKVFAADHAVAGGRLPELLHDAGYPTVADLPRLLALVPVNPPPELTAEVAVLRTVAGREGDLSPARRAGLLSLAAAHLGLSDLMIRYQQPANPRIVWAHSRGSVHQVVARHKHTVHAVAIGRIEDRDVIVSAGTGGIQLWDLAAGRPLDIAVTYLAHAVTAMAIGRVGDRDAIVFGRNGEVVMWYPTSGETLKCSVGYHGDVDAVALGRVGERDIIVAGVAADAFGDGDHAIHVWDAATGEPFLDPITGHDEAVDAVALGRAGDRDVIVSGGWDLRIWDAATGQPLGLPLTDKPIAAVALGRVGDRDIIVSGGWDQTVRRWDAVTGEPLGEPSNGHAGPISAVAMARLADRHIIVSGDSVHTVRLWDAATGLPVGNPMTGHAGHVEAVAAGRVGDRDIVVSGGWDDTVRLWDVSGQPAGDPMAGHSDRVTAIALGRVGERNVVVSGSRDKTVRRWDAGTGRPLGQPLVGDAEPGVDGNLRGTIQAVALGRVGDRDIIVSGDWDGTVRRWDAATDEPLGAPIRGNCPVNALALVRSGDRDVILVGAGESLNTRETLRVWDAVTLEEVGQPLAHHAVSNLRTVAVGRIGDHDVVAAAGSDAKVRLWDAVTGEEMGEPLFGHTEWIGAIAVGRVGGRDILAYVSGYLFAGGSTVSVWDLTAGRPGPTLYGHTDLVLALATGRVADRDVIVSGSDDRTVRVWDGITGGPLGRPMTGHQGPVRAVAVHDNGVIVSVGDDAVRRWDAVTGQPLGTTAIAGHGTSKTAAVGRAAGGRVVVFADDDHLVRTWDAATGQPLGTLTSHTARVTALATGRVADRDVIIEVGADHYRSDHTVRAWDAETGQPVGPPLVGHTGDITALAVTRMGHRDVVVSGSADKTARLWDIDTGHPVGSPLAGHTSAVRVAAARVDDADIIVTAGDRFSTPDHRVRVWNAVTGQLRRTALTGHTEDVTCLAMGRTGDGDVIISGSDDRTVRISTAPDGTASLVQDAFDAVSTVARDSDRIAFAAGTTICVATLT